MHRFQFVLSGALALASIAEAGTIDGAYVGCLTKSSLDEFITAATNNDMRHMRALIGTVCAPLDGREFSIVDRGFTRSQIRVYTDDSSVLLWTVSEAVK